MGDGFADSRSQLRTVDYLLNSSDRHGWNIFANPDTGKLMGIDNEGILGDLVPKHWEAHAVSGARLPDVYSPQVLDAISGMDANTLRSGLPDVLSPNEIDSMVMRLNVLKVDAGIP